MDSDEAERYIRLVKEQHQRGLRFRRLQIPISELQLLDFRLLHFCSDGDVLLHCVVDAILGALELPDIGQIFPDSDPKWKGAAASVFIREAFMKLIRCTHITSSPTSP